MQKNSDKPENASLSKFTIFPAIDLKQGKCVRLFKGDMNQATIFGENPASQAQEFEKFGFDYLHIVDLDGAIAGEAMNQHAIKEILAKIKIPVQLGGGIRDLATIEKWLNLGVNRVILGTLAAKNPEIVAKACKKFPGKIVVGIDAKDGQVAVSGWVETTKISSIELAKKFADCGVAAIIYTDISKDGAMSGFDYEGTKMLAQNIGIPIIASGGICNIFEAKKAKSLWQYGVCGAIIGRAFYEDKNFAAEILKN